MGKALSADVLARLGVDLAHFFGGGVYIKETHIPAGAELAQHAHEFEHLSYLVSGRVLLDVAGKRRMIDGPMALTIEAHKVHAVHALTDARWLCIWRTDCTDPEKVDGEILGGSHG